MGNNAATNVKGKEKFLFLPILILALCQIGTTTDVSVIAIGIKPIMEGLKMTLAQMQIATLMYIMMASCLMLFGGILGLKIGWIKSIRIGTLIFSLGEFIAAFSPTGALFTWGGRLLTGVGGSILVPAIFGCIVAIYQGKDRLQAFGFLSAAMGIGMLTPILMGVIMDMFGWRTIYIILGIYFLVLLALSFKLPSIKKTGAVRLDFPGTLLYIVAIFTLIMCISKMSVWGIVKATPLAPFSLGGISPALPGIVLALILFAILFKMERKIEVKHGSALIPQSFIKNKQVLAGLLLLAIPAAIGGAIGFAVTPFLQLVIGYNAFKTAMLGLLSSTVIIVGSSTMPKLLAGKSVKKILITGAFIGIAGMLFIVFSIKEHTYSLPLMLVGYVGYALMMAIGSTYGGPIVTNSLSARDAQQSGGLQPTARNFGQTLGTAIMGMIMLTSVSAVFSSQIATADITPETRAIVETVERGGSMSFMDDKSFTAKFETVKNTEDMNKLAEANAVARMKSVQYSLYASIALLVLGVLYEAKYAPDKMK